MKGKGGEMKGEGREGGSVRYRNVNWKWSDGDDYILIIIVTSCHCY